MERQFVRGCKKMSTGLRILAVETSCDETSAAVVEDGRRVLSNIISSQIDLHKKFGGVVPELASRKHIESIIPVIHEALEQAEITFDDIQAIGVTIGPGLVGALLVGLSAAKALAYVRKLPLIGVNHIEGHIYANFLEHPELNPPFLALVVSGGHTELVYVKDYGRYELLGRTRDDAAGEAFDKTARALGLGYPGGPIIDELAKKGNADKIDFPRAYLENDSYDFSFSGVKTAVLNYINQKKQRGEKIDIHDVAASFQKAVVEVLVDKTIRAADDKKINTIVMAGGVAVNSALRVMMGNRAKEAGIKLYYPSPVYCTDNAAMIASAAYYQFLRGGQSDLYLNASASLKLPQVVET
ncbi:MAG: tRNA N6-adenosine threonylcarbamoyltransferase [Thermosediminibacterales bacterium]|nr:tRNA N6-adenosine threonylcarbamoyltransferase [Thermosediminibacterales bacterium]MDK2835665.1 tRNA N6-adenosine threonylcarbamoyltransferase [Thermosediminibacterales bacterium]